MKCVTCGAEMPAGTRSDKLYCSEKCRREYYRQLKALKPQTTTCKYCGKEFTKTQGKQLYCSTRCKSRMYNYGHTRPTEGLWEVTCPVCGKTFLYDGFGRRKYCSAECSAKAQKETQRRWRQRRNHVAVVATPPPKSKPEPKPEPKPAPTECRTWVFGKETINFGVPQYDCLKPVEPPPPPPPPPQESKPEWRPWILENRQPTQAEMDAIFNKYFG